MEQNKLESIVLTEVSAKKLREIAKEKGFHENQFRVHLGIQPGGCAGYSYQTDLVSEKEFKQLKDLNPKIKYRELESQGLKLIVDNKSYLFLIGMHVDYDHFHGFKYINPQAGSSCGCGISFSPHDPKKDDGKL